MAVTSPYKPCRAHTSLLPCFATFWNWFAVFERVFVSSAAVPMVPRWLFRFFLFFFVNREKAGVQW